VDHRQGALSSPDYPLFLIVDTTPDRCGMCPNAYVNDHFKNPHFPCVFVKLSYQGVGKGDSGEAALEPEWIPVVAGVEIMIHQRV